MRPSTPFTRRALLRAPLLVALAGCTSQVTLQRPPDVTFVHRPPIPLAVSGIDVVVAYAAPGRAPNVENEMPTSPERALRRWAADRLKAEGGPDRARFTILDAAVVETMPPAGEGLGGMLTGEPPERYDAVAEARLEILGPSGEPLAYTSTRATRSVTVPDSATINEREMAWFDLVEALMADFDADFEHRIHTYLAAWLR